MIPFLILALVLAAFIGALFNIGWLFLLIPAIVLGFLWGETQ